jgi:hypothetical protein
MTSEYRHRDEYRESGPSSGFHHGFASAVQQIVLLIGILLTILLFLAYLFVQWAWKEHGGAVIFVCSALAIYGLCCLGWHWHVKQDKHKIWKLERLAKIGALNKHTSIAVRNSELYGFNAEYVDGDFVQRSTDPKTGSTNNNEYNINQEEEKDDVRLLEAPKAFTLSEQLNFGSTSPNEDTSIIGYMDGEPFRAKIFDVQGNLFNSVFVFGDQGYGKSTFGTYLAALTILQGGKIIVIDPESEADQSLTTRLGPLAQEAFMLCPIADTPDKAKTAVSIARQIIEQYGNNKLLVLIDEFTLIARHAGKEGKMWADVGKEILDMSEEYATRGRKKGCRVICFGQIPKATRSGNTEVRDSMAIVSFNLRKERAQNILELEDAKQAPSLQRGEIILMPNATTYRMQLPYPDEKALEEVARLGMMRESFTEPYSGIHEHSPLSPDTADTAVDEDFLRMPESTVNEAVKSSESIPQFSLDDEMQIIEIARVQFILDGKVTRAKIPMAMKPPRNNKFYPVVKHICDREGF